MGEGVDLNHEADTGVPLLTLLFVNTVRWGIWPWWKSARSECLRGNNEMNLFSITK